MAVPAKLCRKPNCRGIVRECVCSVCGPVKTHGWQDDKQRGSRTQRGYGDDWYRLRAQVIRQKTLEAAQAGLAPYPICALCGKPVMSGLHADHIAGFESIDDPKRLDPANVRITHMRCHMRRTASQSNGEGGSISGGGSS
jgi:5-methylcytosine-specific restriction endonuclease McrA